ncbi:MAG: RluA family pseudouridine synthase [Planctomycetaceae bacterium]|nr:RluA family pseudouridine synthase [Planctomycetaceae bacterium]
MKILYEDNHLLAVVKPSGLATMGLAKGEETLLTRSKDYIKQKYNKPGEVYLGVVSRLDVPVSGVVLFARTSKAAARLNEQFRTHSVEKIYVALVEGSVDPPEDEWIDRIREDERHRKVWLTRNGEGKEVKLQYRTLHKTNNNSLIEIQLETGRKHQIRVQFSGHGFPIFGDRKYGAKTVFPEGIALHALKLTVTHPTTHQRIVLTAPIPVIWKKFTTFF